MATMLSHNQIWNAIDRLAARAKLSPSGLAKKAGLDPTTFNKSKRVTPEGRALAFDRIRGEGAGRHRHQGGYLRQFDHRQRQAA